MQAEADSRYEHCAGCFDSRTRRPTKLPLDRTNRGEPRRGEIDIRTNLSEIPDVMRLVGRQNALAMLDAWLDGDAPSCALIGAAGVGKTALLRAFGSACLAREHAPCDELWWVDIGGVASIEALVTRIAVTCGITLPDSEDPRVVGAEILRALAGRGRVLLLLDGSHHIVLHEREPLPRGAFDGNAIKWVLTARVSTGIAQSRVFVPPLAPDAARTLLLASARDAGVEIDSLPTEDLAALVEQLDRMPLALGLAGRWLLTMSPGQLAAALDRYPQFVAAETEVGGVRVAVEETWRRAADSERVAALALAAVDVDVTLPMAAALWQADLLESARRLERLQWLSIVFPSRTGEHARFSMFGSVRRALLDRVVPAEAHAAQQRLATWVVDHSETWSLARRREDVAVIEWAFGWAIVHDAPLAGRLALANMALAEHGEAFGPTLDQLYAALQRVIDGGPSMGVDAARLYLAIARAHLLARDASGAFEALDQVETLSGSDDGKIAGPLACIRGRALLLTGQFERAGVESRRALSLVNGPDAVAIRAMALGTLAQAAMEGTRDAEARRHLNMMEREASWHGTSTDLAIVHSLAWRLTTATGATEELRPEGPMGISGRIIAEYWFNAGEAQLLMGRFDEAGAAFQQILAASGLDHDTRAVLLRGAGRAVVATTRPGAPVEPQPLAALTRYHEILEWHYPETRARFFWGTLLALSGQMVAAWRQLAAALATAQRLGMHLHVAIFRGIAAIVAHKAGERAAWDALNIDLETRGDGEPPAAGATAQLARHVLAGGTAAPVGAPTTWVDLVASRLVPAISRPAAPEAPEAAPTLTLHIGPDWRWLRGGGGEESSLLRRHAGRGIMQCLVRNHERDPGATVSREDLIEAGWPSERMLAESALARLHTTIWRLRQMGLSEVLVHDGDGYALNRHTRVVRH